ncbi:VWA domain-containing protein [Pseudalkalibacillus hwajinpoensis]
MTGRFIENANFFHIKDIDRMCYEVLYNCLLNEFPDWLILPLRSNKPL